MYTIYNSHKGSMRICTTARIEEAHELAHAAVLLGHDALYRVFGPQGFVTAWSAHAGRVREHRDVRIPTEHW